MDEVVARGELSKGILKVTQEEDHLEDTEWLRSGPLRKADRNVYNSGDVLVRDQETQQPHLAFLNSCLCLLGKPPSKSVLTLPSLFMERWRLGYSEFLRLEGNRAFSRFLMDCVWDRSRMICFQICFSPTCSCRIESLYYMSVNLDYGGGDSDLSPKSLWPQGITVVSIVSISQSGKPKVSKKPFQILEFGDLWGEDNRGDGRSQEWQVGGEILREMFPSFSDPFSASCQLFPRFFFFLKPPRGEYWWMVLIKGSFSAWQLLDSQASELPSSQYVLSSCGPF